MKTNTEHGKKNRFGTFILTAVLALVMITSCGCDLLPTKGASEDVPVPSADVKPSIREEVKIAQDDTADIEISEDVAKSNGQMLAYDVVSVGRTDPFMPSAEIQAFDEARNSAIAEANAYNSKIAKIKNMQNVSYREKDDISPYSFNLPVPPTSLASEDSAAAKITRTKVVGIMYNRTSPSAIINVDNKDYLVRQGDKIIDQKYQVREINQSWITVTLGSNVYSASIGEAFSMDGLEQTKNDLYNLKNRFGGRKG